jgi:hypothetical protein
MWMETEEMNESFQYHPGPSGRELYRTLLQFKENISRPTDEWWQPSLTLRVRLAY